jgi:hypothetical protein
MKHAKKNLYQFFERSLKHTVGRSSSVLKNIDDIIHERSLRPVLVVVCLCKIRIWYFSYSQVLKKKILKFIEWKKIKAAKKIQILNSVYKGVNKAAQ